MDKITSTFSLKGEPYMNNKKYLDMPIDGYLYSMSPTAYIRMAAEILGMTYDQVVKTRLKDHTSYAYIERAAEQGKLTIPVLDYVNNTQDGLHRAMWAKEKGFKGIPVLIYR